MTRNLTITLASLAALGACTTLGEVPTSRVATGTFRLANGLPAGTALITASADRLTLTLAATGLSAGVHGIHLHTVGKCEAPGFTTAGGHLNPAGHQHGTSNPAGSHLGDLPNLTIDSQGRGVLSVQINGSLSEAEAALFDIDGTAIVIHAAPDDYKTDPSGNSGERIACAVLKRA
jgi:superoxide dismutase, Cu-Zn family